MHEAGHAEEPVRGHEVGTAEDHNYVDVDITQDTISQYLAIFFCRLKCLHKTQHQSRTICDPSGATPVHSLNAVINNV